MERLNNQLNKAKNNVGKKLNVNKLTENGTGSSVVDELKTRTYYTSNLESFLVSNSQEKIILAEKILNLVHKLSPKGKEPVKSLKCKVNINYLPPETLLNIFKYLSLGDLKEVKKINQFKALSEEIINNRIQRHLNLDDVSTNIKRLKYIDTRNRLELYKLENFPLALKYHK